MSDKRRERLPIAEQIERITVEDEPATPDSESSPPAKEGLKREDDAEKAVFFF